MGKVKDKLLNNTAMEFVIPVTEREIDSIREVFSHLDKPTPSRKEMLEVICEDRFLLGMGIQFGFDDTAVKDYMYEQIKEKQLVLN